MDNQSTTSRVLSSLAYLSILFLPVIFPLIIWIVDRQDPYVKHHAKAAFWKMRSIAAENDLQDMTLDEINSDIEAVRSGK